MKYLLMLFILLTLNVNSKTSQCYGTTSNGSVSNSIQLPKKGPNFVVYHKLGHILGRNFVHSIVAKVLLKSFAELNQSHPNIKFKYAETGLKSGGQFKPHKTHQNGLSVDFMVPVKNKKNQSVFFPSTLSNRFGYSVEFDINGKYEEYSIDFESLGLHLIALDKQSKQQGIGIKRVIFAPEFRQLLFDADTNNYIKQNITFMKNKAWVRHDEHYHVDFEINCKN